MNDHRCPDMPDERLAAFCEGQSNEAERNRVQRHLERCPVCRETVAALTQSMDQLRDHWQRQEEAWRQRHGGFKTPGSGMPRRWIAAAAAGVLVASGLGIWWPRPGVPVTEERFDPTVLKRELDRAAVAAQLLAAADLLARQPGGRPYAVKRYQYVIRQFPDRRERDLAQDRLHTLLERSTEL